MPKISYNSSTIYVRLFEELDSTMTRNYKRLPGSRKYADFSSEKLEECLNAIRSVEMTQRKAEAFYGISRSTIKRRLKNTGIDVVKSPGHPTVFTNQEEIAFSTHLIKVYDFGFPVDELDFRFLIMSYFDKQGKQIKCFQNNMPGRDWVKSFLKRQTNLFANHIKRS